MVFVIYDGHHRTYIICVEFVLSCRLIAGSGIYLEHFKIHQSIVWYGSEKYF